MVVLVELINNNETLSLALLPIFLILLYILYTSSTSATIPNSPPSPPKLPIIGNLHQLGLLASPRPPLHPSLQALSHVHGPLMLLHFGNVHVLVVSSAEAAHAIMRTHDLASCSRPKVTVFDKLLYDSKDVAAAPYGEYWKYVKSICVLHLLSTKRVRSYREIREEETKAMIKKIRDSSKLGVVISLRKMIVTLTNNVVSRVALGKSYYSVEAFKKLSMEHTELLGSLYIGDYVPWLSWLGRLTGLDMKLDRIAKKFDEFLEMVIREHMENSNDQNNKEEMDFVDVLLQIQREKSNVFPNDDRRGIKGILLVRNFIIFHM